MRGYPYTAEEREDQICALIDARIHAIKHDICANRVSTTEAVLARLQIDADEDEARAILRAAVVGHSAAGGVAHAGAVELAIFQEAEALAETDLVDMERQARDDEADYRADLAQEAAHYA